MSNRDGIGARITVTTSNGIQVQEVNGWNGFLSHHDRRLQLGVGQEKIVDIEIVWLSGVIQTADDITADQVLKVIEPIN